MDLKRHESLKITLKGHSIFKAQNVHFIGNQHFIVEDGICHHGLDLGPQPGPYEAVEAFVQANRTFVIDRLKESFGITWNPKGYLKKIA